MVVEQHYDWSADEYWTRRRLSPAQLLVHDIDFAGFAPDSERSHVGPLLEINEVFASTLLPTLANRNRLSESLQPEKWTANRTEQQNLKSIINEFGWMNCLRREQETSKVEKCRWIHISSKFTEYLQATLLALTNQETSPEAILGRVRHLDHILSQNERFSKHGRYFTPFYQVLDDGTGPDGQHPLVVSVPYLDWSTSGRAPALRYQIDPREGYQSSKSSSHSLRSILQHFYRLEDTSDREQNQVFSRHKPWLNDRNLDLKVRRWFGHYPGRLNVDELWILVVDSRHIVTFASNQTWKSRWPPMQLGYRIAEISFRGIRNKFFLSEEQPDYTAYTHLIPCLSGAVGILHRSFWTDLPLCLTDRYAGYLGHLQYRLHRAPSTRLVMELLQVQEELNIVIQITQQQMAIISDLQADWDKEEAKADGTRAASRASTEIARPSTAIMTAPAYASRSTFRQLSNSTLTDPVSQLLDNLRREYVDLCDLRDNSNNLVNRTIQLVNIRLEDHGKAILVFTLVTIVFLPLSFVSSYLGMNTSDIRTMTHDQTLFWIIAGSLTARTVILATLLAFYGGAIVEAFFNWRASRFGPGRLTDVSKGKSANRSRTKPSSRTFTVLDGSFGPGKPVSWSGMR